MCWCNCSTCNPGYDKKAGSFSGKCFVFLDDCLPCESCGCTCIPADPSKRIGSSALNQGALFNHSGDTDDKLVTDVCDTVIERVFRITESVKEACMDLSKFKGSEKGSGKQYERVPFLKAKHLPKSGTVTLLILDVREAPPQMKFSDILVDCKIGTAKYCWGLREGGQLQRLIEKLGTKSEKWVGKRIKLARGDWDGTATIRIA